MLNINQLQHLQFVAREGSFARAAELANITQPALSNSIRALEQKVGFRLVERAERPVRLTVLGQNLLARVDTLLFEARSLDQEIAQLASGDGGLIQVGMTGAFSTSFAGAIVAEWHRAHPNVRLRLEVAQTSDLLAGLYGEELDLMVGDQRDLPEAALDLNMTALPRQAGGAFCRKGHPILQLAQPTAADLAACKLAGTSFPNNLVQSLANFLDLKETPEKIMAIDCNNVSALRDATVQSDLVLLTTRGCIREALAKGVLVQIPIDPRIDGVWSIVTRKGRTAHPVIPSLAAKISEVARRELI